MATNYDQVSVGTTATTIISSNTNAKTRKIENIGSNTVYVGGDTSITTSNSFPIEPGETLDISDFTGVVYGIVAASTEDVSYIEEDFQ